MAEFAQRSIIFSFFACIWLFIALSPAYCKGRQEPELSRADELISMREYDEATLLLTNYIRNNPDRFEFADVRLRRINQIREEFNKTADELIDMLYNDPENSEGILALTTKLHTLENENSPIMINFVDRIQEIAQFNVYRNQLRRVLASGHDLLYRGDSEGAMQSYAGGLSIMRDEFFAAGYGSRIENSVRNETERINSILASFNQESSQLRAVSTELTRAITSGQSDRVSDIINRLMPVIDRFTALKHSLYSSVDVIDSLLRELQSADPTMGDRNHIAFISTIIHGPSTEEMQEGMLGAFETSWEYSIGSVIEVITSSVDSIFSANLADFNSRNYQRVLSSIMGNETFLSLAPLFFDRHRRFATGSDQQNTITMYGNTVLEDDISSYLELISITEASGALRQGASLNIDHSGIDTSSYNLFRQGTISMTEALNREQRTRNVYAEIQIEIQQIITRANQIDEEMSRHYNAAHIKDAIRAVQGMSDDYFTYESQSAQRHYNIEYDDMERNLAARREEMQTSRRFLDGETRENSAGIMTTYRYPAEALEELTALVSAIDGNLQRGNSVLTQFNNEPQAISTNAQIAGLHTGYQSFINELNDMRAQGISLADTARSRSALALSYRQEGERLYREAQAALQRQNFDQARQNIQRAQEQFNSSLEVQESASLRQEWDAQLPALGQAIAIAENEAIIAEVRSLVNTARTQYFAGEFQQAENNLVRARDRWRITNSEDDEEVMYWLSMVNGGTTARSIRVIPSTAPLYPEMSQLLSQAQRNFEEGVRYINAGQRTEGLSKFAEARQQTQEVKLIFPVNQEAGILEMRMEQFTDPAAFNASFQQRLNTARNGTRLRSMESYADLQNLAEINPNYPGMRGILTQADIDMGFRPPPPNPANIARSNELTVSARRILEANQTEQFEVALKQINEAITLNPDNTEATRVKDSLVSRMNVPGASVLNTEDEEQYQRAMRELQAGNNLTALAIVERLLQNPRNRNVTKVLELQRRIQQIL